ncbi:PASTA domain-containing protein [Pseudaestuariivita rosea]|uniref:PASTA domain-containing protein n=1 Tax=Pseudaestuariivita rosea TaxID=2763263 RepID=UPI001ABA53EC|nr:PASTA domain-containing protein [Pseudaestuariivita rosea]
MPEIVNISQSQTEVAVGAGQSATISFDIVNIAGRPLEIGLEVRPPEGKLPDWIGVVGDDRISLAPSETRKIEVEVAPENAAEAAEILFRLRAYETALPEENNGESAVVTAEVSAGNAPPPKKTSWGLIAGIAAAVVLLIGGGILAYLLIPGGPDKMPDLAGLQIEDAREQLDGLTYASIEEVEVTVSDDFSEGQVAGQSPEADAELTEDTEIVLEVALIPEVTNPIMPEVIGRMERDAVSRLRAIGFGRGDITIDRPLDPAANGTVTQQRPAANTEVTPGSLAKLTIPQPAIRVPDVRNRSVSDARRRLENAGFGDRMITVNTPTQNGASGRVTAQNPAPNQTVPKNSRITLTAPKAGPIRVNVCARSPYAGTWKNVDRNTRDVTRVVLTPLCPNQSQHATRYTLRMFGSCSPRDCDWGNTSARVSSNHLSAKYDQGFVVRNIQMAMQGNTLRVNMVSNYNDNRPTRTSSLQFRK